MDKQKTIENFERLKNSVSTYEYSVTGIPSNAASVKQASFSKNIGEIVGQVSDVLDKISKFYCFLMIFIDIFTKIVFIVDVDFMLS